MKCSAIGTAVRILLLSFLAPGLALAQAQFQFPLCVTLPGSTSVLNPAVASSASLAGVHLNVNPLASLPASIEGRQTINGVIRAPGVYFRKILNVRYRDNGLEGQVRVILKQTNVATGATAEPASFDSNAYTQSTAYQTVTVPPQPSCELDTFDTDQYIYWLWISISQSGAGGTPSLHSIQVCVIPC